MIGPRPGTVLQRRYGQYYAGRGCGPQGPLWQAGARRLLRRWLGGEFRALLLHLTYATRKSLTHLDRADVSKIVIYENAGRGQLHIRQSKAIRNSYAL